MGFPEKKIGIDNQLVMTFFSRGATKYLEL